LSAQLLLLLLLHPETKLHTETSLVQSLEVFMIPKKRKKKEGKL
jgi:hypothetical protein